MSEHVILVAFQVHGETREDAHESLMEGFKELGPVGDDNVFGVAAWWTAEDDRRDGSDCDSAVFCHPGAQKRAAEFLYSHGLTGRCNLAQGTYGIAEMPGEGRPFNGEQV